MNGPVPGSRPRAALGWPAPASPAPIWRGKLRARLTRFVGRERELDDLIALLRDARLVTLVGAGGAGKTRLAIEAADRLSEEFEGGSRLVELAPLGDPAGVAPAISGALGVSEVGARASGASRCELDDVAAYVGDRAVLVVLDNCEHVIAAAAAAAEALLGACPRLRLLATSREALGVPGEALVPVAPLPLETAVALFVDRAGAAAPLFRAHDHRAVVEDVCRRLDGLPLALELAAARLRALPLDLLASRLDDRFRLLTGGARTALPRQQTLRAVVDWSYDLLFEDERRLFARVSSFSGGFTLEAAEAVCADDVLTRDDVAEVLARLVDKSLVVFDPADARYRQLETLRQYGRERLASSEEAPAVRARHARWFRALPEDAEEGLRGAPSSTTSERHWTGRWSRVTRRGRWP